MSDGFFRKKNGYTVVQNFIAKDEILSLRAKGLYLLIQAYITMPNVVWYKSSFEKLCHEGPKSFDYAWKELKERGLLRKHIYKTDDNKFRTEYELMDEPNDEPHTYYYDKNGELSSTNQRKMDKSFSGHTPKGEVPKGAVPKGEVPKGEILKGLVPKGEVNDINTNNINTNNINTSINKSSSLEEEEYSLEKTIEEQIYAKALSAENPDKKNEVDKIVSLIKNALINKKSLFANGKYHDYEEVKNRFMKLTKEQTQRVINKIPVDHSHTKNLNNYILAMLFNEPVEQVNEQHENVITSPYNHKDKSDFCCMKKHKYDVEELLRVAKVN